MRHHSILTLGLIALTLAFASPASAAVEPQAKPDHAPAKADEKAHAPAATTEKVGHAAEEPAHAPAGEPEKKFNPLEVQIPLAVWTVTIFLILMAILGRYAWKPLIKALHERESHLEHVLLDSERARNEAEATAAEHRRQLSGAADEVRALIEQARKEAVTAAESIIKKAQDEAEASKVRAEREIAGARDQALTEIWTKTADLAVSVAGRVLSKEMGEADHKRLVELAMGELPANGEGARA